jgi:hypothetical protein
LVKRLSAVKICVVAACVGAAACEGGGARSAADGGADQVGHGGATGSPPALTGGDSAPGGGPATGGSTGGQPGGANGQAGSTGRGGTAGQLATCAFPPVPSGSLAPAPLRPLTRFEYNNTVRDLFANAKRPADVLPADGTTNVVADAPFRAEVVDGFHTLAHDFALSATKDAASVSATLGCDPATSGEDACLAKLMADLVPRILRRPATTEDQTDFADAFTTGRQMGGTFAAGVRAVLEVALQSPEFLYRVELGEAVGAATPGLLRPTPYEMAARLSFLLLGSTPDTALLAAAGVGKLRTRDEIAAEAKRLLADMRAHDVLRYFTFQLMRLHDADYTGLGAANPGFAAVAPLLLEETGRFVDEVSWSGRGSFSALLTSPVSVVNGPLAAFYGIPGVTGNAFMKVNLDVSRRAGLLTQPSVLARLSTGAAHNPTGRGLVVLGGLLCLPLVVSPSDEQPLPPAPNSTTRTLFEAGTAGAACQACHKPLDSAGFAFEHFDAVGRWQDEENGQPIDARGALHDSDARGTFDGAAELALRLAGSQDARACYVDQWMGFAYGRASTADACARGQLLDEFVKTDGDIAALMFALTQTETFLSR